MRDYGTAAMPEPGDQNNDKLDDASGEAGGDKGDKFVPLKTVLKERHKRQETQAENESLKARIAELEARGDNANGKGAEAETGEVPDIFTDPVGYLKYSESRMAKMLDDRLNGQSKQAEAQAQEQAVRDEVAKHPIFDDEEVGDDAMVSFTGYLSQGLPLADAAKRAAQVASALKAKTSGGEQVPAKRKGFTPPPPNGGADASQLKPKGDAPKTLEEAKGKRQSWLANKIASLKKQA
jgi:hypothetical protein